jgi:NTP pyrophosphatase (non-canonical NTP hydrolase)
MTIRELVQAAYDHAKSKGFHDTEVEDGTSIALMHSELSEALESIRNGQQPLWFTAGGKPEGVLAELADTVIRIADYCGQKGYDLEGALQIKMNYNQTRPHMHGGKKF